MALTKKLLGLAIGLIVLLGAATILTPADVSAAGQGGGKCPCPKTIQTPCGVCKLVSCGSDCVYVCPAVPCPP